MAGLLEASGASVLLELSRGLSAGLIVSGFRCPDCTPKLSCGTLTCPDCICGEAIRSSVSRCADCFGVAVLIAVGVGCACLGLLGGYILGSTRLGRKTAVTRPLKNVDQWASSPRTIPWVPRAMAREDSSGSD